MKLIFCDEVEASLVLMCTVCILSLHVNCNLYDAFEDCVDHRFIRGICTSMRELTPGKEHYFSYIISSLTVKIGRGKLERH